MPVNASASLPPPWPDRIRMLVASWRGTAQIVEEMTLASNSPFLLGGLGLPTYYLYVCSYLYVYLYLYTFLLLLHIYLYICICLIRI